MRQGRGGIADMSFECVALSREYRNGKGVVRALDKVSFSVDRQEFVCIVGPSGCGKTTLLKIIAGLVRPTSGRIIFTRISHMERTLGGMRLAYVHA